MQVLFKYIQERFPVPFVALFSLGLAALSIGLSFDKNIWLQNGQRVLIDLLLLSCIFFFFLLRQRATDEFKDANHDKKYFPDRPVPRGLISKKQILFLGLFAFVMEFVSVCIIGKQMFWSYLIFFLYSLFMAREFFISNWLNKHFTIYFLIHEVIFLPLGLFFVSVLNPFVINLSLKSFLLLLILTIAPMSIEIIRKFKPRFNKKGKPVADTYSTVWGRGNALLVLIFISLFVGLGLSYFKNSYVFLIFSIISVTAWITVGRKSDSAVILIGAINFLGFALLTNIIW